jgi:hypothetical protein
MTNAAGKDTTTWAGKMATPKGGLPKTPEQIERIRQKKREKLQRQKARKRAARAAAKHDQPAQKKSKLSEEGAADDAAAKGKRKGPGSAYKSRHLLFVGQLPFDATEEQIRAQFRDGGAGELKSVRMLHDQEKKFRGIAFIELESATQQSRALRLHRSRFGEFTSKRKTGRMINVERTVGGGGRSERRREKLEGLRAEQGKFLRREVDKIVDEVVASHGERFRGTDAASERDGAERDGAEHDGAAAAGSGQGFLLETDIDEAAREALCTFPRDVAKQVLEEFVETITPTVTNRSAWLMGMLRRYRSHMAEGREVSDLKGGDLGPSSGLCRGWIAGYCSYGDACKFAHRGGAGGAGSNGAARASKRRNEEETGKEVCFAFQKGTCTRGDGCKFAHVAGRIGICKANLEGKCTRGADCPFRHDAVETTGKTPSGRDYEQVREERAYNRGRW